MTRRRLALIGDRRIEASPTPAMHNAIFGDGTSSRLIFEADAADAAFVAAEASVRGVNVTAPHKVAAAVRYAAVADDCVRVTGAANTVVYDDHGRATVAANTDVDGLVVAWRRANLLIEGRVVAIVGAGGAARATVVAAHRAGAVAVVVHARRADRAAAIVDLAARVGIAARSADLADVADVAVIAAADLDDATATLAATVKDTGAVHDLRYGPRATATRNAALARRLLFLDGTSMLLAQGLASAALFQGGPLTDAQRHAAAAALAGALRG
jgi:shikimate dehydrogenase